MTLHTLFSTPRRAALLRRLDDSRSISASLDAFDAILSDLARPLSHAWEGRFISGETDTTYTYTTALPGFKRDKVSVEVEDGGYVRVTASRVNANDDQHSVFDRTIALPEDADPTKVEAKLEDGILTVSVAKLAKPTPPAPRKVTVS